MTKVMHGSVSERPLRELALELIQLRGKRPPEPERDWRAPDMDGAQQLFYNQRRDRHWSHMMTERDIEQEMLRRCGPEHTEKHLKQARTILNLLT